MATFTKLYSLGRQTVLSAVVELNYADTASGGDLEGLVATDIITLAGIPKDAIVVGVAIDVVELFAPGADVSITVADTDKGTAYATADLDATGGSLGTTDSTATAVDYTAADTLQATFAGADLSALTAGKVRVRMDYIQKNRSNEVHE